MTPTPCLPRPAREALRALDRLTPEELRLARALIYVLAGLPPPPPEAK